MASIPIESAAERRLVHGSLSDPARAIGGPRFDAIFFWGSPLIATLIVWAWAMTAMVFPVALGKPAVNLLVGIVGVITFAHLIAVVPRAYLNRDVFGSNRRRLLVVPILLVAALWVSPFLLLCAAVLSALWDVHHSAMQTFGLCRIYDIKAGNGPQTLRGTDLRLNWALYVGPIAAGASLFAHFDSFADFKRFDWTSLATMPGVVAGYAGPIHYAAIAAWAGTLLWSIRDYRVAAAQGYKMPVHKMILLTATGLVSVSAWGFAPPFVAFAIINLFHAVQYFALVWLKEGGRMGAALGRSATLSRFALPLFLSVCAGFGLAYDFALGHSWLIAPFIACSLLHFWFDSFIWSVRKKQV